ncbi:hypothetical protein BG53_03735 [Paenibacillus darwinianus]|uniref:Putative zinc-finger domain-containing protein n=1 Tax=Paenibacillus darwinianus TaxID=1380763 RepID=A0A9W5W8H6_9BACL|nr:zf-HC2 domain-containing protein [Paenibacillus darwinianus]EXX91292.1 hypothetical protein BG52_10985 [Paenibacillus darwinianus]EXX92108.1 hypothetical protein BG53_03735 [Paenibacillus darwinianus]EXX92563.1 hypothetical protein CH50_10265 [Paenibacillus darwinianus]
MKCEEAQELFGVYWDLPEKDPEREVLEKHLLHCEPCAEEFRMWEESESMIRNLTTEQPSIGPVDHVNRGVMNRIYAEDNWFMPVKERTYQFTGAFRRKLAAVIACCLAMFSSAFFYLVFGRPADSSAVEVEKLTGLLDTANASSQTAAISLDFYQDIPVASISDPLVLQVVPTVPQYWVALSLLGMIMTLLTINWISRTRA